MRLKRASLPLTALATIALAAPSQTPLHDSPSVNTGSLLPPSEADELLTLHRHLVEISSITDNETTVTEWLSSYLRAANFTVELQEVTPNRHNILAYPSKRDTTILVTSHLDTVPPFWPYTYNETSGVIGGRGSVDAKGSVATQIVAVQGLEQHLFDDISLLFVVGEETGGDGMRSFSDWDARPTYDIVVFGEPTEAKLVCGHKGILQLRLDVHGKAAHSGYPWLGVSANEVLVEALGVLLEFRGSLPSSEKYGKTTMNFGRIEGGVAGNVVAETATAGIAIRIAAGTPQEIKDLIIEALEDIKAKAEKMGAQLKIEWTNEGYGPVNIDCDVEGFESMTVNYGTDVPNLKGEHKQYLYGPGSIFVAHSDHEAMTRRELEQAVLDFRRLIVGAGRMDEQE